jgi:hypothetical protein
MAKNTEITPMKTAEAIKELKETHDILQSDSDQIKKIATGRTTDFHVRMSVRAYAAFIEGVLFGMRQVALSAAAE